MFAAVDPIPLVLAFLGSSFPTMGIGTFLVLRGIEGWRRRCYPLTETRDLTGFPARLAACLIILFGCLVFISGLATLVFCCWRLYQLLH